MAEIYIRCPSIGCKQVLTVAEECRGMLVTCRFCKRMIRIPTERRTGAPAAAAGTAPIAQAAPAGGMRAREKQ